jgi:flagellar hook-length control protein FliK
MTNVVTGSSYRQGAFIQTASGKTGSSTSLSFSDMLDKQSAANGKKVNDSTPSSAGQQDISKKKTLDTQKNTAPSGTEKATKAAELDEKTSATDTKAVTETNEKSVEEPAEKSTVPDEVLEMMNSLAAVFVQQAAEELGLSEEEMNNLLSDLNMDATDLLKTDNLPTLVLAAGGETDPISLLSKEDLYGSFQQLSGVLTQNLEEAANTLGISVKELQSLMDQGNQALNLAQATGQGGDALSGQTQGQLDVMESFLDAVQKPILVNQTEADLTSDVTEEGTAEGKVSQAGEVLSTEAEAEATTATRENAADAGHSKQSESKDSGQTDSRSHMLNPQTDLLKAQAAVAQAQSVSQTSASTGVDTESIIRQIVDYMKVNTQGDIPSLEMQLQPEHLGTLRIHLAAKEGVVTAQFVAQNETVKNALESQMIRLVESFDEQGIKVDAVEVSVGTNESPTSFDQGTGTGGGAQSDSGRSGAGRRLRSLNLSAFEEGQEIEEEDRLAAEMLRAGGNTVDYAI